VKRGAIVIVAARGSYTSKPRPAVVVQADLWNTTHASVTICPITSDSVDAPLFRLPLPPGDRTGLKAASQIMIDKVVTVPRAAIGETIGNLNDAETEAAETALRLWLGLD
jgi:mRNA interferase MazF